MSKIRVTASSLLDHDLLSRLCASFGEVKDFEVLKTSTEESNVDISYFDMEDAISAVKNVDGMVFHDALLHAVPLFSHNS